jgi:hypothetical protein
MRRFVALFFLGILCIAAVLGLNRKRTPRTTDQSSLLTEAEEESFNPFSNNSTASTLEQSIETAAVHAVHKEDDVGTIGQNDGIPTQPRHDLSPRLMSIITNQLNRLGPLEAETYDKEDWDNLVYAKMDYVAGWAAAVLRFAGENRGKLPGTLDQAAHFYPADCAWLLSVFDTDRFEIVYHGSLSDLRDPPNVILVRERVPTVVLRLMQHWQKAYIYGNGDSGMVAGFQSTDEFQTYESMHIVNADGE